jgi:WD40 repeat protein
MPSGDPENDEPSADIVELLRSPWFQQLVTRLAEVHREPEQAKQTRLEVAKVRGRIPGSVPGDRQDSWVQRVMQTAAREARLVASPKPRLAAARITDELNDQVCSAYPTPVARCFDRFWNEPNSSATARFDALLDTVESLLLFVGTLVVSYRLTAEGSDAASGDTTQLDKAIVDAMLRPKPAMGDLTALVHAGMAWIRPGSSSFVVPNLPSSLLDKRGGVAPMAVLRGFVGLRNKQSGHPRGRLEKRYAELLGPCEADLAVVLRAVAPLAKGLLIRPLAFDEANGRVVGYMEHRGTSPKRKTEIDPPLMVSEQDRGPGGLVRIERFLWVPESSHSPRPYLALYPLTSLAPMEVDKRRDAPHFLCATQWESGRLKVAELDTYEMALDPLRVTDAASATDSARELLRTIEQQTLAFVHLISSSASVEPVRENASARYNLPGVWAEQRYHHKRFVGRARRVEELAEPGAPGYQMLLGVAGTGKSALIAEVFEKTKDHAILHMVKSEREPEVFVRFLLAQLSRVRTMVGLGPLPARAYDGEAAAVCASFWREAEALGSSGKLGGELLVLVDGLDELSDRVAADPWFLQPSLPAGVRVVLSCRPEIPLVPALRARLRDVRDFELDEGLTQDDVQALIQRALQHAELLAAQVPRGLAREMLDATGGNPLFLTFALEGIADEARAGRPAAGGKHLCPAGKTERVWLEHAYARATGRLAGVRDEGARLRERLLWVLSVVHGRAMLELDALQGITVASGLAVFRADMLEQLGRIKGLLTSDAGGRYGVFHKRLADYVNAEVLGAEDRRQVHGWVASWLESRDGGLERIEGWSAYGLEHRPWHLVNGGRAADASVLLTSVAYVMASLDAHGAAAVSGIEEDYREIIGSRGATDDAKAWAEFWRENGHTIRRGNQEWPPARILRQRAWDHATSSPVTRAVEAWLGTVASCGLWVHRLHRPAEPLRSGALRVLEGHLWEVTSVALHADGRRAVSASSDRDLKVWDLDTGACLLTLQGHSKEVTAVALHADGRRAVSASWDETLKVWDLDTGACLRTLEGHSRAVSAVALHADGRRAVSASEDHSLKVWDLNDGACLRTLKGHSNTVHDVALHPDGRRAVSASADRELKVWDLNDGACLRTLEGHSNTVIAVALHPDGRRAVSASHDATLRVWNLNDGACLLPLQEHSGKVTAVALHPDGRRVVSTSYDNTLKVWDLDDGACLRTLQGHSSKVTAVALHVDGRRAVSASWDKTLKVWDLESGPCLPAIERHSARVTALALHADGRRVVSASYDKTLKVWDVDSSACLLTLQGHRKVVNAVELHADGHRAVSASSDRTLKVWDLDGGACLLPLQAHSGSVKAVALHADGRRAVSVGSSPTLEVWDLNNGACLLTLLGHTKRVTAVALHVDGCRAVSASDDHTLKVWDVNSGACLLTSQGHPKRVTAIALHADGRRAVSASWDSTLKVWDVDSGACLLTLEGHSGTVNAAAFAHNGSWIASASSDRTLRIWHVDTGELLGRWDADHPLSACAISPDGQTIAVGDQAGNVIFLKVGGATPTR